MKEPIMMPLNDVWLKYDEEKDRIQNHERIGTLLGLFLSGCFGLAGYYKNDEITATTLFIVSGGIFLFLQFCIPSSALEKGKN